MSTVTLTAQRKTSDWLVAGMVVAALLLGFWLKASVEGKTREVAVPGGVVISAPEKWVIETRTQSVLDKPATETHRVLSTWNPLDPGTRYSVSLLPNSTGVDLATVASLRNFQRAQSLTAYRVLEQTSVVLHGREGYKVTFAFVDASAKDRVPVVFEGIDYFFLDSDQVIVVSLETNEELSSASARFLDFAASVSLGDVQ